MDRMTKTSPIVIVGSGFSGIAMAYYLKKNNIHDFVILEKGNAVGGTWHENKYPGAECDVESHLYSFSFYNEFEWPKIFSESNEIEQYILQCSKHFDIYKHIIFNQNVSKCFFDDDCTWTIETQGHVYLANHLIVSCSPLHCPALPKIKDMSLFKGRIMHTAQWDHSFDFKDKRVAMIGNAASGIQCIPYLAQQAQKLIVFQRTPNWIIPKLNRPFFFVERWLLRHLPGLQSLYRHALFWYHEAFFNTFIKSSYTGAFAKWLSLSYMKWTVHDDKVRAKLTPQYAFGCKRVLLSDNYFQCFNKPSVRLVTDRIAFLTHNGVVTDTSLSTETFSDIDVIVCATGFDVFAPLKNMHVSNIKESKGFMGIYAQKAPNLFLLLGPNSGSAHNGIPIYVESQAKHISHMIATMKKEGKRRVCVKEETFTKFNASVQARLPRFVWDQCDSWYAQTGSNDTLYPGDARGFEIEAQNITMDMFDFV